MGLSFARAACMLAPCAFSHWSLSFFRISFTASLHLFGVFPCFAKAHKIIRVSYDRTFSNEFPTAIVGDADSLFHPVQGDVGQQGRRDPTLRRSMLRCVEHLLLDVSRFQPLFDKFLAGNWANDLQEIVVCNVVERPFDVGVEHPFLGLVWSSQNKDFLDGVGTVSA